MKFRDWLQGAGMSALVLFLFYRSLLDVPGDRRMHTPVSLTSLALSLVANLLLASLVFMVAAAWLRRTSRLAWVRLFLPALILASVAEMIYLARGGVPSAKLWVVALLVLLFFTLVLHWRWPRGEKTLLQWTGAILIGLGFFCIFVVLQLLHLAMWRQSPNSMQQAAMTVNRHDNPKIVWILFDELSYQQVFGERYPGLQLPNFDAFRQSSTLFADMQPVINETEKAIPSILLGQVVTRVDYRANNRLKVGGSTGALHPFDSARTPFAVARQNGLSTGVVGWYNPYCGMLAPYVNHCYWTNDFFGGPSVFGLHASFSADLVHPWMLYGMAFERIWEALAKHDRNRGYQDLLHPEPSEVAANRIHVYGDLMQHAERMLAPLGPDFIFLHLPLPHPPGFYDRETGQFDHSGHRSYIDNLALTDKTLGELLAVLQQSPRWKNTSVIVCGDHSWRTNEWATYRSWTPEDQAASHGVTFDPRPLLMVHLAGQTTQQTVTAPFLLLRVHDILNDLIQGKQPAYTSSPHPMETLSSK